MVKEKERRTNERSSDYQKRRSIGRKRMCTLGHKLGGNLQRKEGKGISKRTKLWKVKKNLQTLKISETQV
jgi:hypothetical protein